MHEFLTTDEIAERLRVDRDTVQRWCSSGKLRAVRAGRRWRIRPADLEAFLNREQEGGEDTAKKASGLALAY